jgi:hypothetical protein
MSLADDLKLPELNNKIIDLGESLLHGEDIEDSATQKEVAELAECKEAQYTNS